MHVVLLSLIPLISYVIILSYPLLNFLSTLGYTLLTLYAIRIPISSIISDTYFLGIQLLNLSVVLFISMIKLRNGPMSSVRQQQEYNKFLNRKEEMIVCIDPALQTIHAITNSACRLYGRKKNQLLGKFIDVIYYNNILEIPPKDFWSTLENDKVWHGFTDIITAKNVICEERAYYTGIKNPEGKIILIEKKIIDVFIKDHQAHKFDYFHQFYEDIAIPMAVINKKHEIEKSNPEFIKNMLEKPILNHTIFHHLFDSSIHDNILCAINDCFNGNKSSFVNKFKGIAGIFQAEYIFTPFYNKTYKKVTHVLFVLKQITKENIINERAIASNTSKSLLGDVLRKALTLVYKAYPDCSVKLFGIELPNILVETNLWQNTMVLLLKYVEKYNHSSAIEIKKIIIAVVMIEKNYFFTFSLADIPYKEFNNINTTPEWKSIINQIRRIGTQVVVCKGEQNDVQISFIYDNI